MLKYLSIAPGAMVTIFILLSALAHAFLTDGGPINSNPLEGGIV